MESMSAVATRITVEEFLALPEDETIRRELIGGEVIAMGRGGQPHEIVKSNFIQELGSYFKMNPVGRVLSETSFQLGPHDSPMPDVSVILAGRLNPVHTGLIALCPDLAVEVVSSESAAVLQAKVKLYLNHGARAVWVAYPELRFIHVYDGSGVRELTGDQLLEAPELLPGFSVLVFTLFVGL